MKLLRLIRLFILLVICLASGCSSVNYETSQNIMTTATAADRPMLQSPTVPHLTPTGVEATPTLATTSVPSPMPTATFLVTPTLVVLVNTPTAVASPTFTPTALPTTVTPPPASITQIELVESDTLWGLAWSPNGKTLALANFKTIWLYDVTNPSALPRALNEHNGIVHGIAFSPDGTLLAVALGGGGIYLWNMLTETGTAILDNPDLSNSNSVAFSPDGTTLAVANSLSNGGFAQLIDPHTQTEKTVIDMGMWLEKIALSNDYVGIVSGNGQRSGLSLVDLHTRARLPLDVHCGLLFPISIYDFGRMAFSPDGTLFAFGVTAGNFASTTGAVQLWDLKQGACRGSLPRYRRGSDYLAFSPDGLLLATTDNYSIRLWNPQTLTEVMEIFPQASNRPSFSLKGFEPLAFSPDGSRLAYVDGNTVQLLALPPDLATHPHPSALKQELLTVNDFAAYSQEQLQTNYSINNADGANQGLLRLVEKEGLSVMALDYVINQSRPNNYVMAERCFEPEQNWQNARFLEMWVENDEQPKTLIVQFGEGRRCAGEPFNGEVWRTSVYLPAGAKSILNLPIDDKLFFGRASWSPQQNNQFDLEKIGYFAVGFESLVGPSSGTIHIGPARLWP